MYISWAQFLCGWLAIAELITGEVWWAIDLPLLSLQHEGIFENIIILWQLKWLFRFPLNLLSYPFSSNIVNIKSKSFTNMLNAWKDQRKVAPFSLHVSVVRYSGCPVCFFPWKSSVRHLGHHHVSSSSLCLFLEHFIVIISNHYLEVIIEMIFWKTSSIIKFWATSW